MQQLWKVVSALYMLQWVTVFEKPVVVCYLTVFFPLCVQQQCIVIIYGM